MPPENIQTPFRSPTVTYTDSYLDNPIQFNPDVRLIPASVTQAATDSKEFQRDFSSFLRVNLEASERPLYAIDMFSDYHDREAFESIIDTSLPNF